ncbi:MAG TPA: MMPL family transporter [Solirubrobacterales bacterium]|nr:MMPL family transporter [Solirubrobacterales bacterium]
MSQRNSRPSRGGLRWNRAGRAIVWLRFPIVLAWIAATAMAVSHLPSAFEAEAGELGSLLPHSSTALEVERQAIERFGLPLLSRTMVVARQPRGFSAGEATAAARYVAAADRSQGPHPVKAVPLVDPRGTRGGGGTTIVAYLYLDPRLSEEESQQSAERFATGLGRASAAPLVKVTGALPGTRSETEIAESHLIWVELATALLVVALLALYFRSAGVPLLGLATVAVAYLCADRVLGWVAERYGLSIPREAEPVIVALIFGVLTDYLVFFVSGYRQRMRQGARTGEAVGETTGELLPVILTAALMIAGATLTLLLSGVRFLSAFGPSMAIAAIVSALVAVTLVPAALAIFGRATLWPRGLGKQGPEESDSPARQIADERPGARGRLIGIAVRLPVLTALLYTVALLAAASGLRDLELGNPVMRGLPRTSEPRQGYDAAAAGIGPGVLGPTMLVLEGPGIAGREGELASLRARLERERGVAAVLGPSDQPLPARAGVMLAPDGGAARYVLILEGDPDGAGAIDALSGIEAKLPALLERSGLPEARTGVTGDTTIASELTDETTAAFERVTPAALVVLLVLLWILLGSWSAPLYLVGSSLLVVAAALGLTVYVFQGLLGYGELAFFVPVASAILLLALGADYNVFLISRIWREADDHELRPAIRSAGVRAGRAITVAGVILALSFAAIALIPIQGFREIAFALCVGLLLDTLLARTLLIPALVAIFGRAPRPTKG